MQSTQSAVDPSKVSSTSNLTPEAAAKSAKLRWLGVVNAPVGMTYICVLEEGKEQPVIIRLSGAKTDKGKKLDFIQSIGKGDTFTCGMGGADDPLARAAMLRGCTVRRLAPHELNPEKSKALLAELNFVYGAEKPTSTKNGGKAETSQELQDRKIRAMALCVMGCLEDPRLSPFTKRDLITFELREAYRAYLVIWKQVNGNIQQLARLWRDEMVNVWARQEAIDNGDVFLTKLLSDLTGGAITEDFKRDFLAKVGADFMNQFIKDKRAFSGDDIATIVQGMMELDPTQFTMAKRLRELKKRVEVMLEGGKDPVKVVEEKQPDGTTLLVPVRYEPNEIYLLLKAAVPGIGPLIGARIIYSIGDIRRFPRCNVNPAKINEMHIDRETLRAVCDFATWKQDPEVARRVALKVNAKGEPLKINGSTHASRREAQIVATVMRERGEEEKAKVVDKIIESYDLQLRRIHMAQGAKLVAFAGYHLLPAYQAANKEGKLVTHYLARKEGGGDWDAAPAKGAEIKWLRAQRISGRVSNWNPDLKQGIYQLGQVIIKQTGNPWRIKLDLRRTYELLKLLRQVQATANEQGLLDDEGKPFQIEPAHFVGRKVNSVNDITLEDYTKLFEKDKGHIDQLYKKCGLDLVQSSEDDSDDPTDDETDAPEAVAKSSPNKTVNELKKLLRGLKGKSLNRALRWLGQQILQEIFYVWHSLTGTYSDPLEPSQVDLTRFPMPPGKPEKAPKSPKQPKVAAPKADPKPRKGKSKLAPDSAS